MPKYVLTYRSTGEMPEGDEMAEEMKAWEGWFGQIGGDLVDGGNPIGQSKTIAAGGVSDGGEITGYTLINAGDIDAAVEVATGCPVLEGDGSVEVGEAIDM